jgi:amino acid adenylation domain-containing protein
MSTTGSAAESAVPASGRGLQSARDYWIERLSGDRIPAGLPADRSRPVRRPTRSATIAVAVPDELCRSLRKLTGNGPFLVYTTLCAALQVCLGRYAASSTVVVGSPARRLAGGSRASNALAILAHLREQESFRDLLQSTRQTLLDAYARQHYPYRQLLADLGYDAEAADRPCPLFSVALALREIHDELPEVGHELGVTFRLTAAGVEGEVAFDPAVHDRPTVERFVRHYLAVLRSALAAPGAALRGLEMLDASDRAQLAAWSRGPALAAPDRLVHELVAARAQLTPEAPAVLFGEQRLSYGQLDVAANRLAGHLRRLGVTVESRVAIAMEGSAPAMVAILAVLKAGAAYAPLDPRQPGDRLSRILAGLRPAALITVESLLPALPLAALAERGMLVVAVDRDRDAIARGDAGRPAVAMSDAALAYVIHTSGSTGEPSGVMVSHRALASRAQAMQQLFRLDAATRQLQFASLGFDVSCEEIFPTWIAGGALVLLDARQKLSGAAILAECDRLGVTKMNLAASVWHNLVDEAAATGRGVPASLAVSVAGAESPSPDKLSIWNRLARHELRFVNAYGPTEAAIMAACHEIALGAGDLGGLSRLPIGRPLPDTRLYLLDADLRPVPVGVPGELHIGGGALARGYFDRPAATARQFIPDPWSEIAGGRMYKSGDLARYDTAGQLDFCGRVDFQVKVRGLRIEPGEIEAALRRHPMVRQATVVAREDAAGDKRLTAYVVCSAETPLDADELRRHLAARLPEPMLPAAFVELAEIPLDAHGKVDRRRLPAPGQGGEGRASFVAPRTAAEARLAAIWCKLLNLQAVGATDNFFQLGGHSLLAMQLVSRIDEAFTIELPLQAVFELPRLADLAAAIETAPGAGDGEPLAPAPRQPLMPLSYAQQRLWFIDQLEPGNPFYNVPSALRLTGRLDVAALAAGLDAIVRRHEVLRTTFTAVEGRPMQQIQPELVVALPVVDLGGVPPNRRDALARTHIDAAVRRSFDLAQGPLLCAILIRMDAGDHVFVVTAHHIVCDAWSIGLFNQELNELYRAAIEGRRPRLPELPIQYADFASWQRQRLAGERARREIEYWRERLAGATFELVLPTDRPRPLVPSFRGAFRLVTLAESLTAAIQRLSRDRGVTLYIPLLTGFVALLYRYTGQPDLVAGSPIAGRNQTRTEQLIGFFPNTMLLRLVIAGEPGFLALLEQVRDVVLGAFSHQELPFERVLEELGVARDLSRQPLFQVMFALQNAAVEPLDLPGLTLAPLAVATGTARFDLTLTLTESGGRLVGGVEYSSDLFDAATIERFAGHLSCLLAGVAADPGCRLADLPLLSLAERHQLVQECNDSRADLPLQATIHALFEAQAARAPQAPALVFDGAALGYGELDARCNGLAGQLRRLGVGPEVPVGLLLDSAPDLVTAALAVLKAGGAYVPLDPGYPPERLRLMLDDVGAPGLITLDGLPPGLALERRWLLRLASPAAAPGPAAEAPENSGPRARAAGPANLAYVIYTSGSTGRPKGVAVPHSAVVRLVCGGDYVRLGADDRVAQASNLGFDAATFEIWGALLNGGCLAGIGRNEVLSPRLLAPRLAELGITTLFLTTALFNQVAREAPQAFRPLRQVLFGGEAVDPVWVRQVLEQGAPGRLLHVYGPTETTTFAAWHRVAEVPPGAATVPLGMPLANGALYVLDAGGSAAPYGMAGELAIGGDGLARGYVGQPALSARQFVPDALSGRPGQRLYRTGDRVRRRPHGGLEFLGRIDRQVKIRGFRIEPGEIEAALAGCDAIRDAAVAVRDEEPAGRRLVAFVVPQGGATADSAALRLELKRRLPEHMIPSAFVVLAALPLTATGKVDRQALLAAELATDAGGSYAPPATPTEQAVAEIWTGILGVQRVGRDDDFFALGGHSLLATQVVLRVKQVFAIELPLYALFESSKLSSFARQIDGSKLQNATPPAAGPRRVPRGGDLPLSFGQQRLWFQVQLEPASPAYNVPVALRLAGRLDTGALVRSLDELVRRHEALRTRFPVVDGEPVQRIAAAAGMPLARLDLASLPAARRDAEALRRAEEASRQPFDLATGPVVRGLLLRLRDGDHALVVTMSHLVADGWSLNVLMRELGELYLAGSRGLPSPLPELPIQYADFSCWQREWLTDEVLEEQLRFWRERLRGVPDLLELPTDRPRPSVQSVAGGAEGFILPRELAADLRQLSQAMDATLFMTLLAAFQVLLYRLSGQPDFCVGAPIANRNLADTEGLVGFFVNLLVMRAELRPGATFRERLREVREFALAAYDHQDVPFDMVVEAVRPQRSAGTSPLVQVTFDLDSPRGGEMQLADLTLSVVDTHLGTSKRDLSLTLADDGELLQGGFVFSSILFDAVTIRRLAARLETLLTAIAAAPDGKIDELGLLAAADRRQLLAWNGAVPAAPAVSGGVQLLFEQQADRTPDGIAVAGSGGQLTYAELEARANRLAHHLRRHGVGAESLVALCLERSEEMVVAILGVLKAGGAYLPLDPGEPRQSLGFILDDARPALLVTRETLRPALPAACPETVLLDTDGPAIEREGSARPTSRTAPDDLLYVIYTSGSTGRPKGVMIAHRQMLNYVASLCPQLDLPPGAGYAMVSTFAADLGCTMLYPALASGGCLHVLHERQAADPAALAEYFAGHAIDALKIVPSHLAALLSHPRPQDLLPRRRLVLGGEASRWEWIAKLQELAPDCVVFNHYGPTETTVGVLVRRLESAAGRRGPVPLGRPIHDTRAYLLDRNLQPVPVGVPGQLHVGGAALGRGYLDRPGLTAERFLPDPFGGAPGGRLYATGDLARHLPDETVEFVGRTDHQVKLRGFRIELGEIEAALTADSRVREAVVTLREDAAGERRLVAYVVAGAGGEAPAAGELRERLRERLPERMIPAAFVSLAELPLTPNGKVDRRALPAPEQTGARPDRVTVPPRDALERQLLGIWQDVLRVQPIGVHDNFFELGGHSLLMVTVMTRIQKATGSMPPLATLLQQQTIADLAAALRQDQPVPQDAPLVRMQPRGRRQPFFCVHPAGGSVLSFVELARQMAPDQPFYALQADGGGPDGQLGIEDLAASYVTEVLQAQPEGPYSLGGHSFGGVVAYEMARQLQRQGRTVALLALLDAAPAGAEERDAPLDDGALMGNFALQLGLPLEEVLRPPAEFEAMTADEQLAEVLRRAQLRGLAPEQMRHDEARHRLARLAGHIEARKRYVPLPYAGRVTLFRARQQLLAAGPDRNPRLADAVRQGLPRVADLEMGWGELAAQGVEVHELPGHHFSMLRPPNVSILAETLRGCLSRVAVAV